MTTSELYDRPVPRYTSYPTFPYWNMVGLTEEAWLRHVAAGFEAEGGEVCLYIHLPYCEDLCTFCACNKRITRNHDVEAPYIRTLVDEWNIYRRNLSGTPIIREIHLGGGTPTFFSPTHLSSLITELTSRAIVPVNHEFSIEVHPSSTTLEHLQTLAYLGFNRISMGVQDFDEGIQHIINRRQTYEQTWQVMRWARDLGYRSVNIDLVYGLPMQTTDHIRATVEKVVTLDPDRIAYYSYAHVPWKSKGQRRYTDGDVPRGQERYNMYALGRQLLNNIGYFSIGMDHYAREPDSMLQAYRAGTLHRNFMGYTTTSNRLVVGLGASAIGDTWDAFSQNEKVVEDYRSVIADGHLPLVAGHLLTLEDQIVRRHILDLMCTGTTTLNRDALGENVIDAILQRLSEQHIAGLADIDGLRITATTEGRIFIRNVCSALDRYLVAAQAPHQMFSGSV